MTTTVPAQLWTWGYTFAMLSSMSIRYDDIYFDQAPQVKRPHPYLFALAKGNFLLIFTGLIFGGGGFLISTLLINCYRGLVLLFGCDEVSLFYPDIPIRDMLLTTLTCQAIISVWVWPQIWFKLRSQRK